LDLPAGARGERAADGRARRRAHGELTGSLGRRADRQHGPTGFDSVSAELSSTSSYPRTRDSLTDQLLAFREQIGPFGTLLYAGHDWQDEKLARRSLELMAEKVMPAVNKAIAPSAAVA
jgi:hypothetical protein